MGERKAHGLRKETGLGSIQSQLHRLLAGCSRLVSPWVPNCRRARHQHCRGLVYVVPSTELSTWQDLS